MKPTGYNRNVIGGKRPNKGITSMPKECITNLSKRLLWECKSLEQYRQRAYKSK